MSVPSGCPNQRRRIRRSSLTSSQGSSSRKFRRRIAPPSRLSGACEEIMPVWASVPEGPPTVTPSTVTCSSRRLERPRGRNEEVGARGLDRDVGAVDNGEANWQRSGGVEPALGRVVAADEAPHVAEGECPARCPLAPQIRLRVVEATAGSEGAVLELESRPGLCRPRVIGEGRSK